MVDMNSEYFHFVPINHSKSDHLYSKSPSFVCQICQRSLKIHPSFNGISLSDFSECEDALKVIEKLDSYETYKRSDSYALTPPDASSNGVTGSSSSSDSSLKPSLKLLPELMNFSNEMNALSINSFAPKEMMVSSSTSDKSGSSQLVSSISVLSPSIAGNEHWNQSMSVTRESMRKDDLLIPSSFSSQTWRSKLRTPKPSTKKIIQDEDDTTVNSSLSYDPHFLSSLFKLLSETYNTDLPLCSNCGKNVLNSLQDIIDYLDYDIESYDEYLEHLDHPYFDQDHFSESLEELDRRKNQLSADLEHIKKKLDDIEIKYEKMKQEELEIQNSMREYWEEKKATEIRRKMINDKMLSLENSENLKARLELLRTSNVVNDSYYIDVIGHYSVINNLDLCKLKIYRVESHKINSALGFVSNLFIVLAKHLNCTFSEYVPLVSGSTIKLLRLNDKTIVQIDKENEGLMAKLGFQKSTTMSGFLSCISEMVDKIKEYDRNFDIPHKINKETCSIDNICLKKGLNSPDEQFTKGFKYLLSNLKLILLWLIENQKL